MIVYSLLRKRGPFSGFSLSKYLKRHPSQIRSAATGVNPTVAITLAKVEMTRRALTVRVLGYLTAPVVFVFPIIFVALLGRARPDVRHPHVVALIAAIAVGLILTPICRKRKDDPAGSRTPVSAYLAAL